MTEFDLLVPALEEALRVLDWIEARRVCDRMASDVSSTPAAVSAESAKRALIALRRKRCHHDLDRVANALLFAGCDHPFVRLAYAQSLLDRGSLGAGLALVDGVRRDSDDDPEAEGLRGRALKQAYVEAAKSAGRVENEASRDALRRAFAAYADAYGRDPGRVWHGVNALALARRASNDGVALGRVFDVEATARALLAFVEGLERQGRADVWHAATALECSVALGDFDAALRWAAKYTTSPGCDAFECGSTLRQLREVWQLDDADPDVRRITFLLEATMLAREDGAEVRPPTTAAPALPPEALERMFSPTYLSTLENYRRGLRCAEKVARINEKGDDLGSGSGFLLRGADLHPSFGPAPVLLTNAHVLDLQTETHSALRPDEATVSFEAGPYAGRPFDVRAILWRSPVDELDTVVAVLAGDFDDKFVCDVAPRLPAPEVPNHIYLIGHPGGGGLSYSMQDTLLLDHDSVRLHYRTPSTGGSSGCPAFNRNWQVLGIHHAGSDKMSRLHKKPGTYQANEGFSIKAIREKIKAELGA